MDGTYGDSDDDEAVALQLAPPRVYRTVFDHLTLMSPAAADRLYGKGTVLDPAVNGLMGGFEGGRAASRAAAGASEQSSTVAPGGEAVPWTCRAVVRSLTPLAQHVALRLCLSADVQDPSSTSTSSTHEPNAVALSDVLSWCHPTSAYHDPQTTTNMSSNKTARRDDSLRQGHPSSTSPPPSPLEEALLELEALFVAKVVAVGGSKDETRGGALMTGATQTIGGGGDGASGSHSGSNRLLKRARNNELSCLLRTCINSDNTNSGSGSGSGNGNGSGNGSVVVAVNGHFRRGLLAALASPSPVPWRDPNKPLKADKAVVTASDVDAYMHEKWDRVLTYLVEPRSSAKVGALVKRFLVRAKLIVPRHDEDDDDDEDDDEDGDSAAGGNNDNGVDDMDEEDEDDEDSGVKYRIGSMGYEFLLQNIHVQMWRFAEEFIPDPNAASSGHKSSHHKSPAERGGATAAAAGGSTRTTMAPETVLRFLFQLSFCQVGQDYPVKSLSPDERVVLDHLVDFGFILRRVRADGTPASRFYPSSVACHLVDGFKATTSPVDGLQPTTSTSTSTSLGAYAGAGAGAPSLSPSSRNHGAKTVAAGGVQSRIANLSHFEAIVQTNFQVVAYTTNELHLKMLGLFCQLRALLPNAVVAVITRRSAMDAFADGITAAQVLSFLETNAHPLARARTPDGVSQVVPTTVRDQLLLWEKERNRISVSRGVFQGFDCSTDKFASIVASLEAHGLLLWHDLKTKKLVARPDDRVGSIVENG